MTGLLSTRTKIVAVAKMLGRPVGEHRARSLILLLRHHALIEQVERLSAKRGQGWNTYSIFALPERTILGHERLLARAGRSAFDRDPSGLSPEWRIALLARLLRTIAMAYGLGTDYDEQIGTVIPDDDAAATPLRQIIAALTPPADTPA